MKYIKTIKDKKLIVREVPNSFTDKDLPEGYTFTVKKLFQRLKKFNEKQKVISGKTKKGRVPSIRAVTPEHLEYGKLFKTENGRIVRVSP